MYYGVRYLVNTRASRRRVSSANLVNGPPLQGVSVRASRRRVSPANVVNGPPLQSGSTERAEGERVRLSARASRRDPPEGPCLGRPIQWNWVRVVREACLPPTQEFTNKSLKIILKLLLKCKIWLMHVLRRKRFC